MKSCCSRCHSHCTPSPSLHALALITCSHSHCMLSLSHHALTLTARSHSHCMLTSRAHSHCTLSLSVHALTHCTHRMLLTGGAIGYGALHLRPRRRHGRSRRGERLLRVVRLWCLLDITLPPYFRRLDTCSLRVRDMSIYRLYTHTHARAHTRTRSCNLSQFGNSAAHHAACTGDVNVLRFLRSRGASMDARDKVVWYCLLFFSVLVSSDTCRVLV